MTQILISDLSEVNAPSWSYRTLRPPRLTIPNLARDLAWHFQLYRRRGLSTERVVAFLLLRIVQRVSYNVGWREGAKA